jgi:predicted dinucleotide-utilizing enzyme
MAKRSKEMLDWSDVDEESLSPKLLKLYNEYRKANAVASRAREAFDGEFKKVAADKLKLDPSEHSIVIGHKWGKLSYAVSNEPAKDAPKKLKVFF